MQYPFLRSTGLKTAERRALRQAMDGQDAVLQCSNFRYARRAVDRLEPFAVHADRRGLFVVLGNGAMIDCRVASFTCNNKVAKGMRALD